MQRRTQQSRFHPAATSLAGAAAITVLAGILASPALAQEGDDSSAGCSTGSATGADATAPCFAKVDDILGGQRHLLRNDDLVVSIDVQSDSTSTLENYIFDTKNLSPGTPSKLTVAETKCTETPQSTRLGRMYNLKNDVIVNYVVTEVSTSSGEVCSQTVFVIDPGDDNQVLHQFGTFPATEPRLALFDADLDGYDDILVMDANFMQFYSPDDVDDLTSSMVFRYQEDLTSDDFTPRSNVVTGDFNGDAAMDIAWAGAAAGGDVKVHFASVCPAKDWAVLGTTCSQAFEIVLSGETIDTGQTWTATSRTFPRIGLAAGDYNGVLDSSTGRADAELVLINVPVTKGDARAFVYDFDSDLKPRAANAAGTVLPDSDEFPVGVSDSFPVGLPPFMAGGRLDWSERKEQVVTGWSSFPWYGLWVLSFGDDLSFTVAHEAVSDSDTFIRIRGIATGRFDPPEVLGGPGVDPEPDFNQQIAVLFAEERPSGGSDQKTLIDIYTIDPSANPPDFTPTKVESARTVFLDSIPFTDQPSVTAPLQAGDLQGRSLRLGAPEKATIIGHVQADTVLGMPPMHVDFITPPDASQPSVLNVSVFPGDLNTQYSFADTSGTQASRKSTTSYTYATKESAQEKISYGIPDVASVSVTAKQSATQTHSNTVAKQYNTYSGQSFKLTAATVFDDLVAGTVRRMNVYSYPVIGESICPAASPDCADDEKVPLHVQFSGADNVVHLAPTVARSLEWYQPVNQPGNLFSYPGSLAQLKADQPQQEGSTDTTPRLQELSDGSTWNPQSSGQTAVTWSEGGGSNVTAGSVSNHTFDASVSVSGSVSIGGFGASASAGFDYNKSRSVSTLNTSTTTFGDSEGVTLARGIPNTDGALTYAGQTYIFGVQAPIGTIQTDIKQDSQVKAQGSLTVGFVADPLSTKPITSGNWWPQAYGMLPDVALNHPQRWLRGTQVVQFNCPIGYSSSSASGECSTNATRPTPANVATAAFYQMKGLFVTPGDTAGGPPTYTATLGDTLTLRARIYNDSLANMPGGTDVHVAFYAQPWDGANGRFTSQSGDPNAFAPAVFIGEDTLGPIPAFCGGSQQGDPCTEQDAPRNWTFAETTWDTKTLDSTDASYWKFWVVTWMENGSKQLVEEIAKHGLKEIPMANLNSLADAPIETYSNNLGFYNQTFALLPPSNAEATEALTGAVELQELANTDQPELWIKKVRVSPKHRRRGEALTVRATLRTNQALDDVMVRFFDGDPADDGVMFDVEMIPHIPTDQHFVVAVPYQPSGCHAKRVFVEAMPLDDPVAPATAYTYRRVRPDVGCRRAER